MTNKLGSQQRIIFLFHQLHKHIRKMKLLQNHKLNLQQVKMFLVKVQAERNDLNNTHTLKFKIIQFK